jgi:hypothetical protein
MTEWGWYKDSNTMRVFIHLLLTSNYHDGEYLGREILRGQCVFGLLQLSGILGISVRNVRTALNHLKLTNELTIETTNRFSIATIVKYNDYQPLSIESDTQNDTQTDIQVANDRQTSDNIQEGNKLRNEKLIPPSGDDVQKENSTSERFQQFWNIYPKKVGKGAAEKAFNRIKPSAELIKTILSAIEKQRQCGQWQKSSGQYIPSPARWLNEKRWEDELPNKSGSNDYGNSERYKDEISDVPTWENKEDGYGND